MSTDAKKCKKLNSQIQILDPQYSQTWFQPNRVVRTISYRAMWLICELPECTAAFINYAVTVREGLCVIGLWFCGLVAIYAVVLSLLI